MGNIFSSSNCKAPHKNQGKPDRETPFFTRDRPTLFSRESPFFSREVREPFFNKANGKAIQTKLTVGKPGDKYEKEADSMANAVVNNSSKPAIQDK